MNQTSNRILCVIILGIAISLSVFVTIPTNDQAYAQKKYPYKATLSGENEVPPVQTSASGEAEFKALANGTIKYRINVTGISDATGTHIHSGKTGENGEVVVDLLQEGMSKDKTTAYGMIIRGNITDSSLKGPMQGKTIEDLASAMDAGDTYVNIHTQAHSNGEIRGQVINEDKPASANSTVGLSTLTE